MGRVWYFREKNRFFRRVCTVPPVFNIIVVYTYRQSNPRLVKVPCALPGLCAFTKLLMIRRNHYAFDQRTEMPCLRRPPAL